MNEIVKSAIKLCIFISLANLPFITISQLIGMDTFLDSFENPNFYLYLQGSVHSIESNIEDGTFIIFQKSSHPDFTVMERDTILLCKDDEGIVCHRIYHINCIGSVKRYHIMGNNNSLADKPIYKKVLLKLSGEALQGERGYGIESKTVLSIAEEIKEVRDLGVEIAIVIGGGNIYRGASGDVSCVEKTSADYMGMLATVINALALQGALEKLGAFTRVLSAIEMPRVAEPFIRRRAIRHNWDGFSGASSRRGLHLARRRDPNHLRPKSNQK